MANRPPCLRVPACVPERSRSRWADVNLSACEVHIAAAITDGGPGVGIVRKATKGSHWRDFPLTAAASRLCKVRLIATVGFSVRHRHQRHTCSLPGPTASPPPSRVG